MDDNFIHAVGQRIRKIRKEKRMTMKELAEKTDLHESTISRYEKGEIAMEIGKLKEIANALQTTPGYIMGWDDDPEPSERVQTQKQCAELFEKAYGKEMCDLLKKVLSLDSVDRMVISSTIDTLLTAEKYSVKKESSSRNAI